MEIKFKKVNFEIIDDLDLDDIVGGEEPVVACPLQV
ncbi:hypothetical protein BJ987_002563 [Nocardia goodfellowii]|uniref:Uncharacterized protein n=1 Tax=Nocardia goodfellowii TaxID=882446 RepID=A0ABS4QD91_9NOCA|nr:hypothetical protein [Nocardia goodfellowii]